MIGSRLVELAEECDKDEVVPQTVAFISAIAAAIAP